MIPDDVVERVRESADIVAIVGEHMKLKRVGNSFRGPCPFHQGKDPNFSVSPRGGYVCFVCHEKGDVFTFVQKRLGLDFVDAVKYVGGKSGIEVKDVARERQGPDPREKFWEINAAAADFFRTTLWETELGAPAREYLVRRELDKETADRFGLGFAPKDPALMRAHLETLGFDEARQLESGLLHRREGEDELRPRFRNRLMFPIYDPQGRVIAFGGRVIGQGEPKYLNSAESPVFVKGTTLYGMNWAKNAIRRDERVMLVEGYFDAIRLMMAGAESVVAPLGTALTEPQAELIRKYTNTVFLLYDSDQAGLKATFRAGDILLKQGFKVHVVTFPEGDDPDTFVARHGKEKLEAQLSAAIDVFERKIQILQRGGWFSDLRRKRVALDRMLPTIRATADEITRGLYISRASEVVGVSEDVLHRELKQPRRERPAAAPELDEPEEAHVRTADRRADLSAEGMSAERELIRLLIHRRQFVEETAESMGEDADFRDPVFSKIFNALMSAPQDSLEALSELLEEDEVQELNELAMNAGGLDDAARIKNDCVSALKRRKLGEDIEDIDRQITLASGAEKDALVQQKKLLANQIKSLGGRRWAAFRRSTK